MPTAGNAAGRTADLLDLSGEPAPPPPLPAGFTPRGIVALAFSCLAGVLGVAVVAWYGLVGEGEGAAAAAAAAAKGGAYGAVGEEANGGVLRQQGSDEGSSGAGEGVEKVTVTAGGGAKEVKT